MANEVSNAYLVTNGGRVAEVLSAMLLENIYDASDLRGLMQYVAWAAMGGSANAVPIDGAPVAASAATSELVGGQSNTAFGSSEVALTPARYVLQYSLTDLMGVTGPDQAINAAHVVSKLGESIGLTVTDMLAALFPSLSGTVGSTGVDLSVDNIYAAQFALNIANAGGRKVCVLHPQQVNDFQTSLRSEVGASQFQLATAEMLAARGPGFRGVWNGIEFWQSDSVNTANAGADYCGAMFDTRAFAYTLAPVAPLVGLHINPADVLLDAGVALVERSRDATNGQTAAILNLYPAVGEAIDGAGIGIVTDA